MKNLHITLLGFGNVGRTIASLLLQHIDHALSINIIDPDEQIEGSILDISHSLSFHPQHRIFINQKKLIPQADFIIYSAGYSNRLGSSRNTVASQNINLAKDIFSKQKIKNSAYIIVITNPVDIIAYHIWKICKIPAYQIIGTGTLLDTIRLEYYLSKSLKNTAPNVKTWALGEHGQHLVPIFSQTTVDNILISDLIYPNDKLAQKAKEETINAATTIRKTQKATYYGIAECAIKIFQCLLNTKKTLLPLSVKTNEYYQNKLNLQYPIFISLPVWISAKGIEVDTKFKIDPIETEQLKSAAHFISKNIYS